MTKNFHNLDHQNSIENIMQRLHYDSYDDWITNFALNLPNIWNEKSAANLKPEINPISFRGLKWSPLRLQETNHRMHPQCR